MPDMQASSLLDGTWMGRKQSTAFAEKLGVLALPPRAPGKGLPLSTVPLSVGPSRHSSVLGSHPTGRRAEGGGRGGGTENV